MANVLDSFLNCHYGIEHACFQMKIEEVLIYRRRTFAKWRPEGISVDEAKRPFPQEFILATQKQRNLRVAPVSPIWFVVNALAEGQQMRAYPDVAQQHMPFLRGWRQKPQDATDHLLRRDRGYPTEQDACTVQQKRALPKEAVLFRCFHHLRLKRGQEHVKHTQECCSSCHTNSRISTRACHIRAGNLYVDEHTRPQQREEILYGCHDYTSHGNTNLT